MIKYTELAAILESELNGPLANGEFSNLAEYFLADGTFGQNDRYEFKVIAGDMEYAHAQRRGAELTENPTNASTYYISAVLRPSSGEEVEGISQDTLNTVISAELDFLIPNCDREGVIDEESQECIRLQDAVLALINDKLSIPQTYDYNAQDGNVYFLSIGFSRISVGEKQIRGAAGMSLSASMYVTFSIVATGISSRDLTLKYDEEIVYTTRLGLARTSTQDSAVPSTSGGVSKNATSATSLTISFDAPLRRSPFFDKYIEYVIDGVNDPFEIEVGYPAYPSGTSSKIYTVCFADTGVNGELNLAASVSVRLVEALEV